MGLQVLNGPIIAAGESLSNGVDCTDGEVVRLTMPADWSRGAVITFQISSDGQGYNDLCKSNGREISMRVVPGVAVVVAQLGDALKAIAWLKIRSGTRDYPIAQEEQRDFAVAIDRPGKLATETGN